MHNFLTSSTPFAPLERLFLANGLRFVCTPPPKHSLQHHQEYFNDPTRGFLRFARMLRNKLTHEQGDAAKPYLPKFKITSKKAGHGADILEAQARFSDQHYQAFQQLDQYCNNTLRLLNSAAAHHRTSIQRQRSNFTLHDQNLLNRLMTDATITIKPADKNLGMVLVDTSWYDAELQRMLSDTITYLPLERSRKVGNVFQRISSQQLQQELLDKLTQLSKHHERNLERWNPAHCDQILKYLRNAVTKKTCKIPLIYLLIKVHKASGLSGRPIVPSSSWATTPASVLVDHLLQEVVKKAHLTHLVKDTKSFVNELENIELPTQDGVFVTADVQSLYTNIDTKLGLELVEKFLHEQGVHTSHISLILDLLSFVMNNSYLRFHGQIYLQIDGTAMGTACAPIYANIVVYMLERIVLTAMKSVIYLYRRFLDDVFAYLESNAVEDFIQRMNELHPKLKFDFVTHSTEAAFLDLRIHKGKRFQERSVFDLSVHQKKMNLYLYIPYNSFHTEAMKKSFIQTELMRYIRNSSDMEEYMKLKKIFYQRLRDRGYPHGFLQPIFHSIWYADRHFFLWPSATLHQHPMLEIAPPLSLCLLKRLARWKRHQLTTEVLSSSAPPVFIIPYSPLSAAMPTRTILVKYWELARLALGPTLAPSAFPIMAYQSSPSLLTRLVYQRAAQFEKIQEEKRKALAPPQQRSSTQVTLKQFLLPKTASAQSSAIPARSELARSSTSKFN